MLSEKDQQALERIVELQGNCLRDDMCQRCPFRSMCLPEFLNVEPPTKKQRMDIAFNVLAHNVLLDCGLVDGTYQEKDLWPKR